MKKKIVKLKHCKYISILFLCLLSFFQMINHLSWEYCYALCHSGSPEMLVVPSNYDHRLIYCWQLRNTKLVPAV